ncbi:MAG: chemotaxis protein CheW, partial [Hydrogenophaga sp.]|nr:chemotaxis protein CheW [Hydrogenophaga sp.]
MDMQHEGSHIARQTSDRAAAAAAAKKAEFLTFRLGAEEYGIDILRV